MKLLPRFIIVIGGLLVINVVCFAAPVIISVDASNVSSNALRINGSNFGSGPTIVIYDDFEGGNAGDLIPYSNAKIGQWHHYGTGTPRPPRFDPISHSGKYSARMFDMGMRQLNVQLKAGTTEVFMSYWVLVPPGTPFPGRNSGPRELSSDSSWKFSWLFDESYQGKDSDVCVPTYTGQKIFQLAGNDRNLVRPTLGWWDWDNWIRVAAWFKANTNDPTSPGVVRFQTLSVNKGLRSQTWTDLAVFDADFTIGDGRKEFQNLNFPGWVRPVRTIADPPNGSSPETRILYDDIYVASGVNSVARVEIGDKPNYADSTILSVQLPIEWDDYSILVDMRPGGLNDLLKGYVYVTDSSGNVNGKGVPIILRPSSPINVTLD